MRELTFEEMGEVAGGWLPTLGRVAVGLIMEYRAEIMGFMAYCTTQQLLAQQAHYDMLYYSTRS